MRRKQPESLYNKSLAAVVQLVLRLSKHSEAEQDIWNIVRQLPATLVDEFTAVVIPSLERPSNKLLRSCIHPALRSLHMENWRGELQEQMCAMVSHVQLRKLSLSGEVTKLWFSTTLVSFAYPFKCTDHIIQQLATSCKSLQVLNICGGREITSNGVRYLLQLQELRDLNVVFSDLTDNACAELLFGLRKLRRWQGNAMLKGVYDGCSESMEDYISTTVNTRVCLANYFPNLRRVSMRRMIIPDSLLWFGTLKHLEHFEITYPHRYDLGMRQFVDIHGKNLLSFSITEVLDLDFLHFVTMCSNLKVLKLKDCFVSQATMGFRRKLPHFQSVEKLEVCLKRQDWFVGGFKFPFFDYSNLHYLTVYGAIQIDDTSLCDALIQKNWLRELRTLELFGALVNLGIVSFMKLLEFCPHLESVTGLKDFDSIMKVHKQNNLGIKIINYNSIY